MIRGAKVGLRARQEADVAILHAELYNDVPTQSRASGRPWVPILPGPPDAPYGVPETASDRACFSVVELSTEELAGEAVLWSIDLHNRSAHIGMSLRPAYRGRGLGTDILRVLCHYGFTVRGLYRLQVDTLADNAAMFATAIRVGFVREGLLRSAAWVYGERLDLAILGRLAPEFTGMSET